MESCGLEGYISLTHQSENIKLNNQASVVQRINHYPVGNVVCFANTYPLDSVVHPLNK